jgi:succinoglycan biosynthesis transport protein ExoP
VEFADYLALLRRRWRLIALGLIVCIAGAETATYLQTPKYRTGTRLLVSATASESAIDEITKRQLASQRAVAYAQYATTGPAIAAATAEAQATTAVSVAATASGSSPFLVITVTSSNAKAAADVANAYLVVLPSVVTTLDQNPSASALPKLSVLESAGVPNTPYSPKPKTNLLVGLALGLLLGFAAALLRETLDATIRRSADLERLVDVELLGVVSKEYGDEPLISVTRPRSRRTEAYRQVRTNLEFTGPEGMPRSIAVTSAVPGEGKTTLAANLAVIASHTGIEVVVVDADLRRPTIADVFQVPESPGLTDVLTGRLTLDDVLQPREGERLTILSSGALPRSPSELLGSTAMLELIEELERRFDLVIIDTAPVLPVTDALVVAVNVAGVVVVTRLAETTRSALRRTLSLVRNVNATVLGVVANGAIEEEDKRYGYGYGYLSDRKAEKEDLVPASHLQGQVSPADARAEDERLSSP